MIICPECKDENNYDIKLDSDGEYYKCNGCGHCFDENGDETSEGDENIILKKVRK